METLRGKIKVCTNGSWVIHGLSGYFFYGRVHLYWKIGSPVLRLGNCTVSSRKLTTEDVFESRDKGRRDFIEGFPCSVMETRYGNEPDQDGGR